MNRYMISGLLSDMRAGKAVLLLSETTDAAREAFENISACLLSEEATVRTNGRERIQADGKGSIRFRSVRSAGLGDEVADVVVVDADRRQHWECIERVWFQFARLGKSIELIQH